MATDPIEVTVRNSSGQQGDETYTVPASSTILELKWQIQQRHSQHPAPELQRLIFCGKILNNGDTIASMGPFVRTDGGKTCGATSSSFFSPPCLSTVISAVTNIDVMMSILLLLLFGLDNCCQIARWKQ